MKFYKPLVSIITVVYNGEEYLEETMQSVLNQSYENVEYIIIDGGSTDGTVEIIKKYECKISYWVSEQDAGIYDAMNKGIDLANGDWISFMNAGDVFYTKDTVSDSFKVSVEDVDLIYGDVEVLYPTFSRFQKAGSLQKLWTGMKFSHQAMFTKTSLLKKLKFNTIYKVTADFDFIYYLWSNNYKFKYLNLVISTVDSGGLSDLSRIIVYKEYLKIVGENKFKFKLFFHKQILFEHFKKLIKKLMPNSLVDFIIKRNNR